MQKFFVIALIFLCTACNPFNSSPALSQHLSFEPALDPTLSYDDRDIEAAISESCPVLEERLKLAGDQHFKVTCKGQGIMVDLPETADAQAITALLTQSGSL